MGRPHINLSLVTMEAVKAIETLREFIPRGELCAMADGARGEEREHFLDLFQKWANVINTMPKTYEQDGLGNKAVAHLHYFRGNQDWFITEKDMGSEDEPGQHQAFGLADLGYGGELGYISIVELLANGIELDLYWQPKTLEEIQTEH